MEQKILSEESNAFKIYLLCTTVIHFRSVTKKDIAEVVSICQEESYFDMELDSMVSAKEDNTEEKKSIRVHNRRNIA